MLNGLHSLDERVFYFILRTSHYIAIHGCTLILMGLVHVICLNCTVFLSVIDSHGIGQYIWNWDLSDKGFGLKVDMI